MTRAKDNWSPDRKHRWNHAIRHKHKGHFYDCCAQPGPDTTWTAWTSILHVCQMCHFFTSNFAGQKWSQTEQMYLRNTGNTSLLKEKISVVVLLGTWASKRRGLVIGRIQAGFLPLIVSQIDALLVAPYRAKFSEMFEPPKDPSKILQRLFCWTKHTDRSRIGIPKMVDLCWFYISSLSPRMKHIYRYIYISFHLPP